MRNGYQYCHFQKIFILIGESELDQTFAKFAKDFAHLLISPYRSVTYYSRQTSHFELKNEQHPDYQRREKIRPLQCQLNDTLTEVADGTLRDLGHVFASFAPTATTMSKRKYKTFLG